MCVNSSREKKWYSSSGIIVQSNVDNLQVKWKMIPNLRMLLVSTSNVNIFGKQAEVTSKDIYFAVMQKTETRIL